MSPLVSVIIPCYNADRWIREAIDSCLAQTYRPLEVIVIDDGSTDRALEIIQSFGDAIRWETGPNRGANFARNRGFSLSRGKYVQFLDADDYLLPEKIERQLGRMRETDADAVYGDWRFQFHNQNGAATLGDVIKAAHHADVLAALLSNWWVAPVALLFRRCIVERVGGWDESLRSAQDTDFIISVAIATDKIAYQPGCYSVYRRYGSITTSTREPLHRLDCMCQVFDKAQRRLEMEGRLTNNYRKAIANSLFWFARSYFDYDRSQFCKLLKKILALDPEFRPAGNRLYRICQQLLGFYRAEQVASLRRRVISVCGPESLKSP